MRCSRAVASRITQLSGTSAGAINAASRRERALANGSPAQASKGVALVLAVASRLPMRRGRAQHVEVRWSSIGAISMKRLAARRADSFRRTARRRWACIRCAKRSRAHVDIDAIRSKSAPALFAHRYQRQDRAAARHLRTAICRSILCSRRRLCRSSSLRWKSMVSTYWDVRLRRQSHAVADDSQRRRRRSHRRAAPAGPGSTTFQRTRGRYAGASAKIVFHSSLVAEMQAIAAMRTLAVRGKASSVPSCGCTASGRRGCTARRFRERALASGCNACTKKRDSPRADDSCRAMAVTSACRRRWT